VSIQKWLMEADLWEKLNRRPVEARRIDVWRQAEAAGRRMLSFALLTTRSPGGETSA
jgi:hypothetical protein